jgi:putative tryptophan/tyrosine transport system substrate-binding protein
LRSSNKPCWSIGRNMQIDIRWGEDDVERERKSAMELVALAPDIIFASGTLSVAALKPISGKLPIVFVAVTDPLGAGFVDSLARPGGSLTGFMIYEYSFGGKRLELLKQIALNVTRVAVFRDPTNPAGSSEYAAMQAVAQSLGVEVRPIDSRRDAEEIERAITTFVHPGNAGLVVTPSAAVSVRREMLVELTSHNKLPAVYPFRYMVTGGGLMSLGPNLVDQCRRAADYVDRILKGERPGDLPVQAPTKYEMAINLKTAKALA